MLLEILMVRFTPAALSRVWQGHDPPDSLFTLPTKGFLWPRFPPNPF